MKWTKAALNLLVFSILPVCGTEITLYVDNLRGSDRNSGSADAPLATIERACFLLRESGRIEVVNTGKPYALPYGGPGKARGLNLRRKGTPDKPVIVEGNGATVSGLARIPAEEWKQEENRLYSLPFRPMSNVYKSYRQANCWLEGTKIWFVDGKEAPNCRSEEELHRTPGGFWWNKSASKVLFHLPEGKLLASLSIMLPANYGFYIRADHVIVQNFVVMGSWNDGFDTAGNAQNAVYRNCVAIGNCGQGFSAHGTTSVYYEDCVSFRCASSAVCNVDLSRAVYKRCVLAENTFEAAVYLTHDADALFEECLIADPDPFELIWQKQRASLAFADCVLIGNPERALLDVQQGSLSFLNCTLLEGASLVSPDQKKALVSLSMVRCLIQGFPRGGFRFSDGNITRPRLLLDGNHYSPRFTHFLAGKALEPGAIDRNAALSVLTLRGRRNSELPVPAGNRMQRRGAVLPDMVWENYQRWKNARVTPDGIVFSCSEKEK